MHILDQIDYFLYNNTLARCFQVKKKKRRILPPRGQEVRLRCLHGKTNTTKRRKKTHHWEFVEKYCCQCSGSGAAEITSARRACSGLPARGVTDVTFSTTGRRAARTTAMATARFEHAF